MATDVETEVGWVVDDVGSVDVGGSVLVEDVLVVAVAGPTGAGIGLVGAAVGSAVFSKQLQALDRRAPGHSDS